MYIYIYVRTYIHVFFLQISPLTKGFSSMRQSSKEFWACFGCPLCRFSGFDVSDIPLPVSVTAHRQLPFIHAGNLSGTGRGRTGGAVEGS